MLARSRKHIFLLLVMSALTFPGNLWAALLGQTSVVKVGVYQNEPGVFIDKMGKVQGFYIDLLEHTAEKEGWQIEYVQGSWAESLENLSQGRIDLLVGIAFTEERGLIYDFTKEVAFSNWGQLYVLDKKLDAIPKLHNKLIAGVKGDVYTKNFRKMLKQFDIKHEFIELDEYEEVLQQIEDDDVDAGIIPRSTGLVLDRNYGIHRSLIVCCAMEVGYATQVGKNGQILQALDRDLKEWKNAADSLYFQSFNRWFFGDQKIIFPEWGLWALAGGAGLLVLLFVGNVILRSRVRAKTLDLEKEIIIRKHAEMAMRKAMHNLLTIQVSPGVFWLQVPEAQLYILCGCPGEVVKHLMRRGFIQSVTNDGVTYETGPNVILLSDVLIQNGGFANLSEFPVLQMLYRQGMMLPKHPNNTGQKPMLIGASAQVRAQVEYIYRGNYGLVSKEEILACGVDEPLAENMMRIKLKFAFGHIASPAGVLDTLEVSDKPSEIRNGVMVSRTGFNKYRFFYRNQSTDVDLNLPPGVAYESPYPLGHHWIKLHKFAVLHTGEGDGWDKNRPSMSSAIMYDGRIYLIDAGPGVLHVLTSLGIDISEVEGIFHTHAHDDHFAGLPALIRTDRRMKYFATPLVRSSVAKKLAALMSIEERQFEQFFAIHDIYFDQWNDCQGLEVKPLYSPHPLENNILLFRAKDEHGYHSYAHWADLSSFKVLDNMVGQGERDLPADFIARIKENYHLPANIKKLDIGGGMIHGVAEDFRNDLSGSLIFAHIDRQLTITEMEIGSEAFLGAINILIPGDQDYQRARAFTFLREFFPDVDAAPILQLMDCPIVKYNAGTIIRRSREDHGHLDMVVSGTVVYLESATKVHNQLSIGALIGGNALFDHPVVGDWTYRTVSNCSLIRFSTPQVIAFLRENDPDDHFRKVLGKVLFLRKTWLFGEETTSLTLSRIARELVAVVLAKGEKIVMNHAEPTLWIVGHGCGKLFGRGQILEEINPGGFFGEHTYLADVHTTWYFQANDDVDLYRLSMASLLEIPIVHWKMLEILHKREELLSV